MVGAGTVGKAFFTVSAGYLPGGSAPAGRVTFTRGSAHLKFRSTGFDWLVVSGSRAVLQGSGTVNGKSGYGFRVTATDRPDTFTIRIWKKAGGAVVYDGGAGAKVNGVITVGFRHR